MGSKHLPAISENDQDSRDRFWAATRSKPLLHNVDNRANLEETNVRRSRGAFTRRLPPLGLTAPIKVSSDSGFSDPSHFDETFSKPNLPGSLEDFSPSQSKDVTLSWLKAPQNSTVKVLPAKDSLSNHQKTSRNPTARASLGKDSSSNQLKTAQNPTVRNLPHEDSSSNQLKTSLNPNVSTSPAKDSSSNQLKTTKNSTVRNLPHEDSSSNQLKKSQNPNVSDLPHEDSSSNQLKTTLNPNVSTSPAKDSSSNQLKTTKNSTVNDLSHEDSSSNQLETTLNPNVSTSPAKDSSSNQLKKSQNPNVNDLPHEDSSPNQLKTSRNPNVNDLPHEDSSPNQLKTSRNPNVSTSLAKDSQSSQHRTVQNSLDTGFERHNSPKRIYRPNSQLKTLSRKPVLRIGLRTISHSMPPPENDSKGKTQVRDSYQNDLHPSESIVGLEIASEVKETQNVHPTDRPTYFHKEAVYTQNPSAEKEPLRSRPQFEKAPIRNESKTQKTLIKNEHETQKATIPKLSKKVEKKKKENLSSEKLVTIFPMRAKPNTSETNDPIGKASVQTSLLVEKTPASKVTAARVAAKSSAGAPNGWKRRTKGKLPFQGKTAPINQRWKKVEAKVDNGVKRASATRRPPLPRARKKAASTSRNRSKAMDRSRLKERLVFDGKGNLVLRKDHPPPPQPSRRPRRQPLRPPRPQELRRRYLGREAPRGRPRPTPALSGPRPELSRREAGQWRRVHRKFGAEPIARRRDTRHDRYLQQVECVQLKAAVRHNQTLMEMARRREESRWRQAAQLWKVRDRFREERQDRWRRQWLTPKAGRQEVADRHLYGLPQDELAPVMEAPERPRRAPIERFDYAERRRVNLRRYAAHLGLDRPGGQPGDRTGDTRMPRVGPPVDRTGDTRMPRVGPPGDRTERQRDVESTKKTVMANSKMQDDSLEISGTRRDGLEKITDGRYNTERSRDRRVYQAYPQGRKPKNLTEKRPTIPMTTRAGFAAKLTAGNAQKPREQASETKRRRNGNNQEHLPQLTKREKALGSIASLRTVDFLDNEPEVDTFDAFDKARIKYNIEIDSLPEDDDS